jgi:hypothetical protein
VDYHTEMIRTRTLPDFFATHNAGNHVPVTDGRADSVGLHPATQLARVLNLSLLRRVYWNYATRDPEFRQLDGYANADDYFVAWLDSKLKDRSPREREPFVAATLRMLNADRRVNPYQPVWAALWSELEPHLAAGAGAADRWRQLLGLRPYHEPCWFIVLRYTAAEAGDLFRPTQLDGGWYGYHFPSPQCIPVTDGGLCMDCSASGTEALREYIHQQTDHQVDHWRASGHAIGFAEMRDPDGFVNQRRRHHDLLVRRFGEPARLWRLR